LISAAIGSGIAQQVVLVIKCSALETSEESMRFVATIFAILLLSGCGTPFVVSVPTVPNATEWKALHQNIFSTFISLKLDGSPEISPLHKNDSLGTPAESAICLRNSGGNIKYFVFLISQNKIVDTRLAIQLDRCNEQSYSPLPKP
jgi:hypothetical protein